MSFVTGKGFKAKQRPPSKRAGSELHLSCFALIRELKLCVTAPQKDELDKLEHDVLEKRVPISQAVRQPQPRYRLMQAVMARHLSWLRYV